MKAFIITSLVLAAIGGLARLILLAIVDYPRNTKGISRGDDALHVVVAIVWCAWAWVALSN
jgi:hypothetical protein